MPTGVTTSVHAPTINNEPMMALYRPPPAVPGAAVDSENMFQSKAPNPLLTSTAKIQSSTDNPSAMATMDSVIPKRLRRRRWR